MPDQEWQDDGLVAQEAPPPARLRWGWLEVLLVFVAGIAPAAILQMLAMLGPGPILLDLVALSLICQSTVWVGLGLWVIRARGDRLARIGWQLPARGQAVSTILLGYAGVVAVFVAMAAGSALMIAALSLFMAPQEALRLLTREEALQRQLLPAGPLTAGGVAVLLVFALLVPIAEEVMFRGLLQTALRDRWGATAAVLLSSAAFAAIHLLYLHMLALFLVAVVLALLRERTGSLLAPAIAHAGLNTITILIWQLTTRTPFSF